MHHLVTASSLLACGLLTILAPAERLSAQMPQPASFRPEASGQISFVMPSQNIGCTYTPGGGTRLYRPFDGGPELACDRIDPTYVRVVLTPSSLRRFDKVDDQGCCSVENVFAYGSRWSAGPFTCQSATSGLTCMRSDGRGFVISRANVELR
jgi:hypothetical protein